jgi:uncharacterized protein
MLVAIIADTHLPRGSRRLPSACVERLRSSNLILHAGDFTGPDALAELEEMGPPLVAVHGNVDAPEIVERFPERTRIDLEGVSIGVLHDAGPRRRRLERLRRLFPEAAAVVFGHSHLALHEEASGFQIFNPGSPTERRRAPAHTMGLARVGRGRVRFEHLVLDR